MHKTYIYFLAAICLLLSACQLERADEDLYNEQLSEHKKFLYSPRQIGGQYTICVDGFEFLGTSGNFVADQIVQIIDKDVKPKQCNY